MCDLGHHDHHDHFGFLVDTPKIRALIDETTRLTAAIKIRLRDGNFFGKLQA